MTSISVSNPITRLSTRSAYITTGKDVETNEEVAIKLEHHTIVPSLLEEEANIYRSLSGRAGFPQLYWDGVKDDFTVMVFELLGPNLEDLFRYCGNRFSLKTTLMILDQLLRRFESLHSVQYLHRDVKPENFLMGMGKRGNFIYMTDLGLAIERYPDLTVSGSSSVRDPQMIGTCRYASINGHLGIGEQHSICYTAQVYRLTSVTAQSRGDDLEALGYMMLYFMLGSLPWQGLKAPTWKQKYRLVLEKKQTTSVAELCGDLPQEFAIYMNYVRNLRHEDKPDYGYLQRIFRNLFRRQRFEYDQIFDWTIREYQRQSVECAEQSSATRDAERCLERSAGSNRRVHQDIWPRGDAGKGREGLHRGQSTNVKEKI